MQRFNNRVYVKMLSIQHEKQNLLLKKSQWEKRKLWKIVFLDMKELKWIEKGLPESWEIEGFGARLRCGGEREKRVAETKKKVQYKCKNAFFISERWRKQTDKSQGWCVLVAPPSFANVKPHYGLIETTALLVPQC